MQNLDFKGWNHVRKGIPGESESTDLGRDNLSREIGRKPARSPPLPKSLAPYDTNDHNTDVS